MGIFQRNGVWYARIRVNGKDQRQSCGSSKARATALQAEWEKNAEARAFGEPKPFADTLADFVPAYLEWAKVRKDDWKGDERKLRLHLVPALGHLRLDRITRAEVTRYQGARLGAPVVRRDPTPGRDRLVETARKVSAATVNREVACLRKVLSHAVECGELAVNPLLRMPMLREAPARQPALDPEDEARLYFAAPPWLRRCIDLAIATGMREGEVCALRWKHLDPVTRSLVVVDSKSGESRRVPLGRPMLAALVEERKGKAADDPICPAQGPGRRRKTTAAAGGPLTVDAVTDAFPRACARAGIPGLHFHDLRHVAASRLLAQGATISEVATLLGHKTLHIATRYAHTSQVRLAELVERMGEAF